MIRIVCHGGAGSFNHDYDARNAVVERAAHAGRDVLVKGGSAVDAVVAAVSVMEDDPLLNAGTGSYVQLDGMVRMDASVMDHKLDVGAVIGIHDVKNPIQVARRLMEEQIHSVLAGDLATEFAWSVGFPQYDPRTVEKLEVWLDVRKRYLHMSSLEIVRMMRAELSEEGVLGTVGCVALDEEGHVAAGTSTGGLMIDLPGRVGDVPLIGCGTYAKSCAGVSCTGIGERIIKVCLAKAVAHHVQEGLKAQEACEQAMSELDEVKGRAGIICIDHDGNVGVKYNTASMTCCVLEE